MTETVAHLIRALSLLEGLHGGPNVIAGTSSAAAHLFSYILVAGRKHFTGKSADGHFGCDDQHVNRHSVGCRKLRQVRTALRDGAASAGKIVAFSQVNGLHYRYDVASLGNSRSGITATR